MNEKGQAKIIKLKLERFQTEALQLIGESESRVKELESAMKAFIDDYEKNKKSSAHNPLILVMAINAEIFKNILKEDD